ncbi:MAG: NADH-quinone oxidoreductase subunit J [Chloroflexi bacterium]|nr:NADH-quinone oxidoreductase subunit J [Chloroflexota bacterium]
MIFWLLAIVSIAAALAVVSAKNVFRAALGLILCFVAVAGLYVTLNADFLAAVQVLIYVGGIAVLIVLAIMLTREIQRGSQSNRLRVPAFLVAAGFFGAVAFVLLSTGWKISTDAPVVPTTPALAEKLVGPGGFVLAVEIVAALLLAAVLGAIVLVREK